MIRFVGILAVCLALAAAVLSVAPSCIRTARHFTCLKCRATRWDRSILGHYYSTTNDSEFTAWYLAHFPAHEHVWSGGCKAGYDIFGRQVFCGYSPTHPVALMVAPTLQKEFAESTSASNLTLFYELTLSTNHDLQQQAVNMVYREAGTK